MDQQLSCPMRGWVVHTVVSDERLGGPLTFVSDDMFSGPLIGISIKVNLIFVSCRS